jgi:hypothetical protein
VSLLSDDEKVQHLQQRWSEGALDLQAVERLLGEVIQSGAWQSFHTPNGVPVQPASFKDFITAEPFQGLGATEKKIADLLGDDNTAVVKMRKLLKRQGDRTDLANNVSEVKGRNVEHGNRRDYTLDRLQRDAPELFDAVHRKELSPNAAAIKAGFRPKTFTVRADRPESIARTLRRQLDPEVLALVAKLLSEEC